MEKQIIGMTFDEERALYNLHDAEVADCVFAGPADGESALKESGNVRLTRCSFSLRYPLWHSKGFSMELCTMDGLTRAAIWYARDGKISRCVLNGVKVLRECDNVEITDTKAESAEFGWKCRGISLTDSEVVSEYLFLDSRDIALKNVRMRGKYSFQYVENLTVENSVLDTKDAFWHSRNVTVRDSKVKGEYLGWFSEGLTLINCEISGTQPFCYCRDLKLVNCTMEGTDLAFEYSDVEADIRGNVLSVKNPRSGRITLDSVGEIITDDPVMECTGEVIIRG